MLNHEIFLNCFDKIKKNFFDVQLIFCDWDSENNNSYIIIINDISEKITNVRYK